MKTKFYLLLKINLCVSLLLASFICKSQLVTTIAGGGNGDGGSALNTSIFPQTFAADNNGNIFFTGFDYGLYTIRRISGGKRFNHCEFNGNSDGYRCFRQPLFLQPEPI